MLFGAHTIHQKLVNELNESSYLVTYIGGGHEYAGKPFSEEKETILGFINQTIKKEKIQVHKLVETGKTCDMDTPSSN